MADEPPSDRIHRWTTPDGQRWECDAYDHGPFCRQCRPVAIDPPSDSLAPFDRCHTPACSRPHLDGEAWCGEHHPLSAIQPPFISPADVDAFLDSLDFMTIQRAWDRKSAQLHVVRMPRTDDDE